MKIIDAQKINYSEVAEILKQGGVMVYPTDTAYALGASATVAAAMEKIYNIKQRERGQTLPLIAGSIETVRLWFVLEGLALALAKKHWPGPLTLILPVKKDGLAKETIQDNLAAVRVPKSDIAQSISQAVGAPIVSTSANLSGAGTFYSLEDVYGSLGENVDSVDILIDAGVLPRRPVSTIVKVWNNKVEILRQGAVKVDA